MSWLRSILATLFGSFFDKLLGNVRQGIDARQVRADQQALGQADQRVTDLAAAAEAGRRMQAAGAAPAGKAETQRALDDGRF